MDSITKGTTMATQKGLNHIRKWNTIKLRPKQQISLFVSNDVEVICVVRGRWKAYLPSRVGSSVNFSNSGNRTITIDILTIDRFENDNLSSILMDMGFKVSYANSCFWKCILISVHGGCDVERCRTCFF